MSHRAVIAKREVYSDDKTRGVARLPPGFSYCNELYATSPALDLPLIDGLNLLFPRLCQLLHQRHERHVDGLIYRWREWVGIIGKQFTHQRGVIAQLHASLG